MKNISFDNPYWLLLAIPLLLLILVPFFIAANKDNRGRGWGLSLICHVLIVATVVLAAADPIYTTVMTRTKIYVVVDTSYSMTERFDEIDAYIGQIAENLPPNSRLGIVCFGRDSMILTSSGTAIKSVREAVVDDSGTDIAAALDFTSNIFSEGELKRIILITDGCDTTAGGSVISAVERLSAKKIKLDTVYVNSNLAEGVAEVQLSEANYTESTYLNHESELKLLLEANTPGDVLVDLYVKSADETEYEKLDSTVVGAEKGINVVEFPLRTDTFGTFDYKAVLTASDDTSDRNNVYTFTQSVAAMRKLMLVTERQDDVEEVRKLYGDDAEIDAYVVSDRMKNVPYTTEALSAYDEIILSNVDIRKINNASAFVDSVDSVLSSAGKSLLTLGDLSMQNKDDPLFTRLEELLPISFGNANKDEKLYTLVLDVSRSMNDTSQLLIAKDAAIKLISLLDDADSVIYVPFAGKPLVKEGWSPRKLGELVDFDQSGREMTYREWLYREIQDATPVQGTMIGEAFQMAYDIIKGLSFGESQVMLISDGYTFGAEPKDPAEIAKMMHADGIAVSAISVLGNDTELAKVAEAGGGTYYSISRPEEVAELVFATIADQLTESVIEKKTPVNVVSFRDDVLDGILSLPDVNGFLNSKGKIDAMTVLSVDYQKSEEVTVEVPLYAYREHGNGRVACFTGSLSGGWLDTWSDAVKEQFFGNVLVTNTPRERVDYPFGLNVTYGGDRSVVEILPTYPNPRAKAYFRITHPDGTQTELEPAFDRNRYASEIETLGVGKYSIDVTYSYGSHRFTASTFFDVPYYPEYDAFAVRDEATIYEFMRNAGTVYTDGNVDLTLNRDEIATYEYSMRVPLLIAAIALFVIDVFIRKTRWKKRKGLLRRIRERGGRRA